MKKRDMYIYDPFDHDHESSLQIDDPANPFATGAPLTQAAPSGMPKYIQVVSKQMVGIYMAIW